MNKVYICIPVHNRINFTLQCMRSIFKQSYSNFHVVISDAGSTDGTKEIIEKHYPEKVTVLSIDSSNFWTGGINACIKHVLSVASNNDLVYTLNNDTEIADDCIKNAVDFTKNHSNNIIGSLNLFYDDHNKIEPSAFVRRRFFIFHYQKRLFSFGKNTKDLISDYYHADMLSGKGVLYPIVVFKEVGLFNEVLLPHYHADTEFVFRLMKHGYYPILLMSSQLYSHVKETGIGTQKKNLSDFLSGFSNIKSAIYFRSVFEYSKLVYGNQWLLYFIPYYYFVILGYFKRLLQK